MSDKTASKETEKDEDDKPEEKKTLSLGGGTLSLGSAASAKAKQSLGGNGVAVEIRRSRRKTAPAPAPAPKNDMTNKTGSDGLTADERDARIKALQKAIEDEKSRSVEEAKKPKPSVPAGGSVQTS